MSSFIKETLKASYGVDQLLSQNNYRNRETRGGRRREGKQAISAVTAEHDRTGQQSEPMRL